MPPNAANYDSTGIEYHVVPEFSFCNGTTLHEVQIAYRSYNPSSEAGTILIPTCFSGWINSTLTFTSGASEALARYHVVVAAMLGNGESSSPSNARRFPQPGELHYEDVIHAHHHLLTKGLGVKELEAVVGFSMGGQQAYHWAVMYPDFVKRIVGICTSARTSPHNYAVLDGPIGALINSIDYLEWKETQTITVNDNYVNFKMNGTKPRRGLIAFGRAFSAWLTSADWFREQHWKTGAGHPSVEHWVAAQGQRKLDWDADDLLVLATMWQMGNIGKTARGEMSSLGCTVDDDESFHEALGNIKCPVLLLPCRTDQYFRPEDNEIEMKYLKHGKLEVIESIWGHLAGGGGNPADTTFMGEKISELLNSTAAG